MPERKDEVAEGDSLHRYILFTNSHDGSGAASILPTSVRVVCMNTLRLALREGKAATLKIRHTGEIADKLEAARQAVGLVNTLFDANLEDARKLAGRKIGHHDFIAYLDRLIPLKSEGEDQGKAVSKHRQEVRAKIKDNFYSDPRQQLSAIRGTAWAAFNAVTHYTDHQATSRGKTMRDTAENGFYSVMLGAGNGRTLWEDDGKRANIIDRLGSSLAKFLKTVGISGYSWSNLRDTSTTLIEVIARRKAKEALGTAESFRFGKEIATQFGGHVDARMARKYIDLNPVDLPTEALDICIEELGRYYDLTLDDGAASRDRPRRHESGPNGDRARNGNGNGRHEEKSP